MNVFKSLFSRNGNYSLPFLIYLHDADKVYEMRFVNDTKDCTYNGNTYKAGVFSYKPNAYEVGFDGGGTLEIAVKDTLLIDMVESSRQVILEVVGALKQDNTIDELSDFIHENGTATVDRHSIKFSFDRDKRLDYTFPALIWNSQNNRGNS